jgi:hypothetical protein
MGLLRPYCSISLNLTGGQQLKLLLVIVEAIVGD